MLRSLLIAPIYNVSPLTGAGQRTHHIYRALARLGSVDMVLVSEAACADLEGQIDAIRADYPDAGSVVVLRSTEQFLVPPMGTVGIGQRVLFLGRRIYGVLRPRQQLYEPNAHAVDSLTRLIEANRYGVVVGRYLQATALSGALRQRLVPVVVDLDDLDEMVLESRLRSRTTSAGRRLLLRYYVWQITPLARRLRGACRHVFVASEGDRTFVRHPSSSVLPNIPLRPNEVGRPDSGVAEPQETVVLFVATHGHRVNREGLAHFMAQSWPSIRRRVSAARLRIVGSGGWESQREQLEKIEGVEVVGRVPELSGEYARARLCVVPLYEGSGTKIKVLEALMYGRVVVASGHSARGYESLVGNGVVVANSDEEMADACVELLQNPARCESASAIGKQLVEEQYSFEALFARVRDALSFANSGAQHSSTPRATVRDGIGHG